MKVFDMLGLDGREGTVLSHELTNGEVAWQVSHQAPWYMPPMSRVVAMSLPVGVTPTWEVSLTGSDGHSAIEQLPEELVVSSASWWVRIHNDEGTLNLTRRVPVRATLHRTFCTELRCDYHLDSQTATNLLGFHLGPAQIPPVPPRWPRPWSTFLVDVQLTLNLEPVYLDANDQEMAPEFEVRFGFVPGEATVSLSTIGSIAN